MARHLETSISEMACLVGCSRSAIVSTYRKWCMEQQFFDHDTLIPSTEQRPLCIIYQDQRVTMTGITSSYNNGKTDSVSEHTLLDLDLCQPVYVSVLTVHLR